jgi:hypothetical protein
VAGIAGARVGRKCRQVASVCRFGAGDQAVRLQPSRQAPDQRGEDGAVGPVQPGPGIGGRSTAISCRGTSSSASLEADGRLTRRTSLPQSLTNMRTRQE